MIERAAQHARRARAEDGFTMLLALGVLLVTGLLLLVTFSTVLHDTTESHHNVVQQEAYYAALAGVQEYEYKLQANPNYWENCETLTGNEESGAVGTSSAIGEHFEVALLPASKKSISSCAGSPFETVVEATGSEANTFRVVSTGCAGEAKVTTCPSEKELKEHHHTLAVRQLVATFKVTGFLNYVYFTQYEDIDPSLNGTSKANCTKYYEEGGVKRSSECQTLLFATEDSVKGPMHTDDAANVTCSKELTFGRKGQQPLDPVEINGGTWPSCGSGSEPTFYTESKTYSKGSELIPPESDESLASYAESAYTFEGPIKLFMNGGNNQFGIYSFVNGVWTAKIVAPPPNGLIYDKNGPGACTFEYKVTENDTPTTEELEKEKNCGIVYVEGTYAKALTIAGLDVVITGNTYPTTVTTLGNAPTGTATLGLIATDYVRVYHPCTGAGNQEGYMTEPFIYAAILSTDGSFLVDNYTCGAPLKKLNVYGAIAQKFRGPVGTGNGAGTNYSGYLKKYEYDPRLAAEEPPYFLSPLKTGWKIARLTAVKGG